MLYYLNVNWFVVSCCTAKMAEYIFKVFTYKKWNNLTRLNYFMWYTNFVSFTRKVIANVDKSVTQLLSAVLSWITSPLWSERARKHMKLSVASQMLESWTLKSERLNAYTDLVISPGFRVLNLFETVEFDRCLEIRVLTRY